MSTEHPTICDETLQALINSARPPVNEPGLPPGSREEVLQALQRALVNRDCLHELIRRLQDRLDFRDSELPLLREEQTNQVVSQGLDALEDGALAGLALNPVAMHDLFDQIQDQIEEGLPAAWADEMRRNGEALLAVEDPAGTWRAKLSGLLSDPQTQTPELAVLQKSTGADSRRPTRWDIIRRFVSGIWEKPARAVAILIIGIGIGVALAPYIIDGGSPDPEAIAVLVEKRVIANIRESKSIPAALWWEQWERSQGDPERIRRAGSALYYVVQEAWGDVTAGPDRDLVAPIIWDIGKELFLLGFYNEDRKAEEKFYKSAELVWRHGIEQNHRATSEVWLGLANCGKARKEWNKAKGYLEKMLEARNLNPTDKARGKNFLAFILTKLAEQKDLSSADRKALLAQAEEHVRKALTLTRGTYAKAYANLYRTLSLQAKHEKDASRKETLEADAKKALRDGVAAAKKKLSAPDFRKSARLWFTLSILYTYQELEEDALEAFRKARDYETRDFVVSIWAKTEPAFERLSPSARKLLNQECAKSKYKRYAPATFSVVWDEEFPLPPDPAGVI